MGSGPIPPNAKSASRSVSEQPRTDGWEITNAVARLRSLRNDIQEEVEQSEFDIESFFSDFRESPVIEAPLVRRRIFSGCSGLMARPTAGVRTHEHTLPREHMPREETVMASLEDIEFVGATPPPREHTVMASFEDIEFVGATPPPLPSRRRRRSVVVQTMTLEGADIPTRNRSGVIPQRRSANKVENRGQVLRIQDDTVTFVRAAFAGSNSSDKGGAKRVQAEPSRGYEGALSEDSGGFDASVKNANLRMPERSKKAWSLPKKRSSGAVQVRSDWSTSFEASQSDEEIADLLDHCADELCS